MVIAAIVLWLVLVLAIVLGSVYWVRGPGLVKKTVAVHTKDGKTLKGVLQAKYVDRWVLRETTVVEGSTSLALGGLQHIPVKNISFAQELLEADD